MLFMLKRKAARFAREEKKVERRRRSRARSEHYTVSCKGPPSAHVRDGKLAAPQASLLGIPAATFSEMQKASSLPVRFAGASSPHS